MGPHTHKMMITHTMLNSTSTQKSLNYELARSSEKNIEGRTSLQRLESRDILTHAKGLHTRHIEKN